VLTPGDTCPTALSGRDDDRSKLPPAMERRQEPNLSVALSTYYVMVWDRSLR